MEESPLQKNLQSPQTAAKWRANQVCKRFLTDVFFYGQQMQKIIRHFAIRVQIYACLLYTSPSPRDRTRSRMPSSA